MRLVNYRLLFALLSVLLLPLSAKALENIQVGTTTRTMITYVPAALPKNRPLLISMHGSGQDAAYQKDKSKLEEVADTAKFVVVYPNGINNQWDISGTSDITFITTIIDSMVNRYQIDRNRVYLSGFSMGGMMTYYAATKIADKIAAFAPISGYMMGGPNTNSSRPIPIIHTHGTGDDVVAFSGVQTCINAWLTRNGCPTTAVVTSPYPLSNPNSVGVKSYWGPGTDGVEMVLIALTGKGHWYSDDPSNVMTSVEIWNFCKKYTLYSGKPIVSITSPSNNSNFITPASVSISANATDEDGSVANVKFYNGSTLLSTDDTAPYSFQWANVSAGTYTLKAVATDNEGKTSEAGVVINVNLPPAPALKSVTPENESFDLPLTTNTFKFTYNKLADCSSVRASMTGPAGTFNLELGETGFSDILTFRIPTGITLSSGDYSVIVSGIKSQEGTVAASNDVVMYTFGPSAAGGKIDTLYKDNFSTYRTNGYVPVGWKLTSNEIGTRTGSTSSTYTSGPRLYYFSTSGKLPEAMYLRTNRAKDTCRFVYGSSPEYRLRLKTGKHKFSMLAAGWKAAGQNCSFALKNMDGSIVFSNAVVNANHLNGADGGSTTNYIANNVSANDFTFLVPADTTYLLEIQQANQAAANGVFEEVMVGRFMLQSIPSIAAIYKNMLNTALASARSALVICDSSIYSGGAKETLNGFVDMYSTVNFTAPGEYSAASASLNAGTSSLLAHKSNVDLYLDKLASAKTQIATTTGTKYEQLATYTRLINKVQTYGSVALTNDASLKIASDSLSFYTTLLSGKINAVPILTKRLSLATSLARALRMPVAESDLTTADAMFTDDDNVANTLLTTISKRMEDNMKADCLKFRKDTATFGYPANDPFLIDSLEMTCFIKNPNFYTLSSANNLNSTTFPGWTTSANLTGTGVETLATSSNPVVDSNVKGWNINVNYMQQVVTNLPKGVYDIGFTSRTAPLPTGMVTEDIKDSIFCYVINGSETLKSTFPIIPGAVTIPTKPNTWIQQVAVTGGTITLGFHSANIPTKSYQPTLYWGDPVLYMVGRVGEASTGTNSVQAERNVKDVEYFSIEGIRIKHARKGLYIVKTTYNDGSADVKKVLIR